MLGVPYSQLNYVYMGLSGQSLGLVYTIVDSGGREKQQKQIVVTGKEAVTRFIVPHMYMYMYTKKLTQ